jgi:hypothetical protein
MEMKHSLMHSNDPRFIIKNILNFEGMCYYANHYEKIIRDGYFMSDSYCLNGPGRIINYNNNKIIMIIGMFCDDRQINTHMIITTKLPFYKICDNISKKQDNKQTYYCNAVQKKYKPICADINECITNQFKETDVCEIFTKITMNCGNLIDYESIPIPTTLGRSLYTTIPSSDIF